MQPVEITFSFSDASGDSASGISVYLKLNGQAMILTDGTQVSTKEVAYTTDSNGEVTLKMYNENQFNKTLSRGLDDPPSYTLRVPNYSIRRIIALPEDGNSVSDLIDIEEIDKVE